MIRIPRVAVFRPAESEAEEISQLFQRHDYSVRTVVNADEIHELAIDEGDSFDVVVIPMKLASGMNGVNACLQVRAHEEVSFLPILGLAHGTEKSVIQTLYDSGADVVQIAPVDADLFYLQVSALARQKKAFTEYLRVQRETSGLSKSFIHALDSVREGLLIFNSNHEFQFANTNAKTLLGLPDEPTSDDGLFVDKNFRMAMETHEKHVRSYRHEPGEILPPTIVEDSVRHSSGAAFHAAIRVSTLSSDDGVVMGFAVAVTDLGELDQLSNKLTQALRSRSLCLAASAGCLQFLEPTQSGILVSPMQRMDEFFEKQSKECSLNSVLTSLLEFVDLVIDPAIRVKVNVKEEANLAMRPSDFFQLAGNMILHSVEHAGLGGEVIIDVGENVPGEGITLLITSKSRKVTPFLEDDRLSDLIRGQIPTLHKPEESSIKVPAGIQSVYDILQRYRTDMQYKEDNALSKLRVRLPARPS